MSCGHDNIYPLFFSRFFYPTPRAHPIINVYIPATTSIGRNTSDRYHIVLILLCITIYERASNTITSGVFVRIYSIRDPTVTEHIDWRHCIGTLTVFAVPGNIIYLNSKLVSCTYDNLEKLS